MGWYEVGLKRMMLDWMRDPIRRWHVGTRIIETVVPAFLVLWWLVVWWMAGLLAGALMVGEWVLYEFVLEPYCGAGPYFERGPRNGETFTRW